MRVLMLGWELPPYNSGGLGVACYNLCKALARNNVDIEFVLPYQAEHDVDFMQVTAACPQDVQQVLKSGTAYDSQRYITKGGYEQRYDLFTQQRLYEVAVGRMAASREFDIIHAHDWLTFRAALRAKEASGCPIILHVHSVESDRAGGQRGNALAHEIEAMALQVADRIVAVSDFTRRAIVRGYGIPAAKVEVVHNSIEPSELQPIDCGQATTYQYLAALKAQGYHVVVNVGRLTVQKGLPNFLRAAQIVVRFVPKTMFLIVGSGDQYHELIELAAELGISRNVIFTDFQRGKPWRDAFGIADLFVMPSVSEPFGLTPLEAINYGTSVLISKQSGVSEVLRCALKVDFWDVNEMANKIIAVVQNSSLREELLGGARGELEVMSWAKAADKLLGVYRHHLKAGAGV